eukprot:tig00001490_g8968.t1
MANAGADQTEAYELRSLSAPRLAGVALKSFAWVATSSMGGAIINNLMARSNVLVLRNRKSDAAPTFLPLVDSEAPKEEREKAAAETKKFLEAAPRAGDSGERASIDSFAAAYRSKAADPVAVVENLLAAIEDSNRRTLGAVIKVERAQALEQARASSERHAAGRPLGLLDGVPVLVKDELDVAGYDTGVGTTFLAAHSGPARADAEAVRRLRAAGAVVVGKTCMQEIGIGVIGGRAEQPGTGTPRNPFNLGHYCGGSSSGSASAAGAGLVPFAVGADGGGSIRIPASFCGCVGLKPTFARVPERGAFPLCPSVAHVGPIGGSVRDVAIAYAAMAGPDPEEKETEKQGPVAVAGYEGAQLAGLRVGIYEPYFSDADPEVVGLCREAVKRLEARGARVVKVAIPRLEEMRVAHAISIASEMAAAMNSYEESRSYQHHVPDTSVLLACARAFTSADYVKAMQVRTESMAVARRLFAECDVVATPSTAVPAPAIASDALWAGESNAGLTSAIMRFAFFANLTGIPGISVPVGYAAAGGLPVGLQLMGPWWSERLLLGVAHAVEADAPRRAPPSSTTPSAAPPPSSPTRSAPLANESRPEPRRPRLLRPAR